MGGPTGIGGMDEVDENVKKWKCENKFKSQGLLYSFWTLFACFDSWQLNLRGEEHARTWFCSGGAIAVGEA